MIRKSKALSTTPTLQTIYTVPNGKKTEWCMLWVSNISGSNGSFDVTYYNKEADATVVFFADHVLSSKDFFHIGGNQNEIVVMHEGDYIQLSSTQDMTALISLIEYDDIVKGG